MELRETTLIHRRMQNQSLYTKLGGRDAVEAVVSDFYDRVLDDESVSHHFDGMDMEALYAHQVQFISAVAGGPVDYEGADMRTAHDHLDISETEFDAIATHLDAALREHGVAKPDRNAILGEVEALREPILA